MIPITPAEVAGLRPAWALLPRPNGRLHVVQVRVVEVFEGLDCAMVAEVWGAAHFVRFDRLASKREKLAAMVRKNLGVSSEKSAVRDGWGQNARPTAA